MGLGTDHRLSLAQNPILLARQIAILLASCNRDVARLRKRRQVAGREEIRAGDSESRAQFGRKPRAVHQLFQDVVRHLVTALLQKPSCFLLLLIIDRKPFLRTTPPLGTLESPSSHLNTLSSMYYRSVQSRLGIPCCDSPDTIQFFKHLEPFINCQRQAKRLVLHF